MNTARYSRIVWKEYRAQRTLWIALLAGTALLQSQFFIFSSQLQRDLPSYPLAIAAVLSVCYAVASGALLFAGEREEETDRLLQSLGVGPWELIGGKLTCSAVSLGLFTISSLFSGLIVTGLATGKAALFPIWDESGWMETYILSIPLGLVCAVLASLVTRRVVAAVIVGVVLLMVSTGTAQLWTRYHQDINNALWGAVLLGTSLSLTSSWLNGGPRWTRLLQLAEALPGSNPGTSRLDGLLRWSALRTSPVGRSFGVLVWRELRGALPILLAGLVVTSGWIAVLMDYATHHQGEVLWRNWAGASNLGTIPFLGSLGLFVYAGDNRRQLMRFYADRGVSPGLIWLAKQLVWLSVLGILGAAGTVLLLRINLLNFSVRMSPIAESRPSTDLQLRIILSSILSGYAVVQLLGIWCRKTILAGSIGFVACLFLAFFHYLLLVFRIPLWLSSGPILLGALGASYFTFDGWLKETRTWKRIGTQNAWVIVPCLFAISGSVLWRIFEIPLVDPGFDWMAHEREMAQLHPEWTEEWQQLVHTPPRTGISMRDGEVIQTDRIVSQFTERLFAAADQIAAKTAPPLDAYARVDLSRFRFGTSLMRDWTAERLQDSSGDLRQQWRTLQATVNVMLYSQRQSVDIHTDWYGRLFRLAELEREFQKWSQQPGQSPELLDQLIDLPPQLPFYSAQDRYVFLRQGYEGRSWGKNLFTFEGVTAAHFQHSILWSLLWMERQRAVRLLNWQSRVLLSQPPSQLAENEKQITNWEATTPLMVGRMATIQRESNQVYRESVVNSWVTKTIAQLEKFRLQHGHYPLLISEYQQTIPERWFSIRRSDFRYVPQGLDKPLVVAPDYVIPAGQPLLFQETELTTGTSGLISAEGRHNLQLSPEGAAVVEMLDSNGLYWGSGWNRYRRKAQYGAFPEVIETLKHIPPETDRITYVRFGRREDE